MAATQHQNHCDLPRRRPARCPWTIATVFWDKVYVCCCLDWWSDVTALCRNCVNYSLIGPQVNTHEKWIPEITNRVTTNPRPRTESSRRGESRFTYWVDFIWSIVDLFFQNNFPKHVRTKMYPEGLDSPRQALQYQISDPSNASIRSEIIFLNFHRKSSWCVCAR